MAEQDDDIEQTLLICREVKLYQIPPRPGATGYRSGEWRVADCIFTGRLRMVSTRGNCEIRLEDVQSGDLFAMCIVRPGGLGQAVEGVTDSSRYFVLRIEDPDSGRHAFLGLGFNTRDEAFDFNAALHDHQRISAREQAINSCEGTGAAAAALPAGSSRGVAAEVAALYQHQDLSLKEGQTIKIDMKKGQRSSSGGGFLQRLQEQPMKLQPPQTTQTDADMSAQRSGSGGLPAAPLLPPPPGNAAAAAAPSATVATSEENWATFD